MFRTAFGSFLLLFSFLSHAVVTADKTGPLEQFQFLIGRWDCSGKFLHSGKSIQSEVVFEAALEGKWLIQHHDDHPPFNYHALYEWGFDKSANQYVATVQDSSGGLRTFYSHGWNGEKLMWQTKLSTPEQRFIYSKSGNKSLQVDYAIQKGSDWDTIDTLTCALKG